MRKYIEREAAIDYLTLNITWYDEDGRTVDDYGERKKIITDLIDGIPEAVHGKWIDETFEPWGLVCHPYKCNQCGEHSEIDSEYCPHCGAIMKA